MNKKQLIVAWIMGILICLTFWLLSRGYKAGSNNWLVYRNRLTDRGCLILGVDIMLPSIVTIFVIGGLLIYTLRDKKMKTNNDFQESDRKKKIKRIIAREGLIIISLMILSALVLAMPTQYKCLKKISRTIDKNTECIRVLINDETGKKYFVVVNRNIDFDKYSDSEIDKIVEDESKVIREYAPVKINKCLIIFFIFLIYPFYLLVRFIIWAVRTLRGK